MEALNEENAQIKPEPKPVVVKEEAPMNAIAKTEQTQSAADLALEVVGSLSLEMETLNDEFGSRMNKLTEEFGARMNTLRDKLETSMLEVEELRDHEVKALGKFRAFKALMTTLSDD